MAWRISSMVSMRHIMVRVFPISANPGATERRLSVLCGLRDHGQCLARPKRWPLRGSARCGRTSTGSRASASETCGIGCRYR